MAQIEEVQAKLIADEEYRARFNAWEGLVKWQNLTMNLYHVFDLMREKASGKT
jgi:hypothetical protein